jgi:branched-chain amino acid transport system ATP-binding protein
MTQVRSNSLSVNSLSAGYTDVQIVREVSLAVRGNEIVTIVGPNGCGKSTLLKAIFGLVEVSGGQIVFNDIDITRNAPERNVTLGLSLTPQTDNIFPNLTIEENLEMGAFLATPTKAEQMALVYQLFPILAERRRSEANRLSGGQRQMLAIARSLMTKPTMLLLDEPSAGLSPKYVDVVFEQIRAIRDQGIAILLIEQNVRIALSACDRAYVLATGRNEIEGSGEDILKNDHIRKLYLGG